jgi:hypothetical protein
LGISAATAATVEKPTNMNYSDNNSVLSDLTSNLSLRESEKKKEDPKMVRKRMNRE